NKKELYVTLPNKSEIWFAGLDDSDRVEKILGNEYVTIYLNETSQISWQAVGMVITRLAQKVMQVIDGKEVGYLKPRMYYDCNPPNKAHWTYKVFIRKVDPDTGEPLPNADSYNSFQINPHDNAENLSEDYLSTLDGLSERLKRRFRDGTFSD
ncbi:phage terminase large subunit, partial [Klebsiella pneumoniae]|uniref:phage terminase large subunit n=1 Tax=Klebsiella pneumoniae TaxID=573 RepID=UPI003A86496B